VEEATDAEVTAETGAKFPDAASIKQNKGVAKAWARVDGVTATAALDEGYNISSVDDDGTGNYGVNLSITMGTATYAVTSSIVGTTSNRLVLADTVGTGAVEISTTQSTTASAIDADFSISIHGVL
jgi:hypothetical protein